MITSVNPATGRDITHALFLALGGKGRRDFGGGRGGAAALDGAAGGTRTALLTRIAAALRAHKERFARLITEEMGKPITESDGEVEKCAVTCEFYAANAAPILEDEAVPNRLIKEPETRKRIVDSGADVLGGTPRAWTSSMRRARAARPGGADAYIQLE